MTSRVAWCFVAVVAVASCRGRTSSPGDDAPVPPMAAVVPVRMELHGDVLVDPYAWLRHRDDPRTRAYVMAENDYTTAMMRHTVALQEELYREMLSRIVEDDTTVPAIDGPFAYYSRGVPGKPYAVSVRKPVLADGSLGAEQVVLDGNALAGSAEYFAIGHAELTEDHTKLAIFYDTSGDEHYRVRIVDIATGAVVEELGGDMGTSAVWANDGATLFYTRLDDANRSHQLWRHRIGGKDDVLVHQEDDEMFDLSIYRTRSDDWLVVQSASQITSEARLIPADRPDAAPAIVEPRRYGVEYELDHLGDRFVIRTNYRERDYEIVTAPVATPGQSAWVQFAKPGAGETFDGIEPFAGHLVVSGRARGLPQLWVHGLADGSSHRIDLAEPTYSLAIDDNPTFASTKVRIELSSPVTPPTIYDYDMNTRKLVELKREPVPGYDPSELETQWLHATAADGTRVPISFVRRRDIDGKSPVLLQGYGAYGATYDAEFSRSDLALLERGVGIAIAHVRGGGELGREWYEQGKFLHKKNTFTDFIACAESLVDRGIADPERLAIEGGSAGGLLVGAVTNMRPDLFRAVVADVPFVDVINTMLDASLPLTAGEWDEWGDPRKPDFYRYMRSYSPYENVRAQSYPDMLVLAGWNDPRVGYWEPAKWVARLRSQARGTSLLLLRTDMGSGHGGPSGRYAAIRERAFVFAFVLDRLDVVSARGRRRATR
jgi:oligopeptidase B